MGEVTVKLEVRLAWRWTWLYVPGVVALAQCGMEPDWDKVRAMAARAIRVRIVPAPAAVQA